MTESCGNCRFWLRAQVLQPGGWCRFNPPVTLAVGQTLNKITNEPTPRIDTAFPVIMDTGWCGKWAPRPSIDVRALDMAQLDPEAMEGRA